MGGADGKGESSYVLLAHTQIRGERNGVASGSEQLAGVVVDAKDKSRRVQLRKKKTRKTVCHVCLLTVPMRHGH